MGLQMYDAPETRLSLLLRLGDLADNQAWSEFLTIYQPVVLQMAQHHGLQEADAHDLVQNMFSRIAKKAKNWQTEDREGTFRGWLAITTRNLVIDHFRKQKRLPQSVGDSQLQQLPGQEIDQEFDLQQRKQLFQWAASRCRSEFTENTWMAFWLTAVDNHSVVSVSQQLSLSSGAVYIARSRVMARIRSLIENSSFDTHSVRTLR